MLVTAAGETLCVQRPRDRREDDGPGVRSQHGRQRGTVTPTQPHASPTTPQDRGPLAGRLQEGSAQPRRCQEPVVPGAPRPQRCVAGTPAWSSPPGGRSQGRPAARSA